MTTDVPPKDRSPLGGPPCWKSPSLAAAPRDFMFGFEVVSAARSPDGADHPAGIYFRPCGIASYDPSDVRAGYCAKCGLFIGDEIARLFWVLRERLPMFTICDTTTADYPGRYVARLHLSLPTPSATRIAIVHDDLAALRQLMPPGCVRLMRAAADDPVVLETWL